jgi:hypothetical protein
MPKKFGHTPNRRVVALRDAVQRIEVAVDWRRSDDSEPALVPPFYRLEQSVIDKVPARADSSRPIAGRWRAASRR